jgi:Ca2+-binding EF-hand superfamily protein
VDVTKHLLLSLLLASAASPALPQAATASKGPQPISRTVYMSRVDSTFGAVDANKDGFSDKSEIEAFEAKALAARKAQMLKQRETAFRQMDKDKNGTLSLAEFNAAMAAQTPKPNAAPQIARLDTNKDGRVSMAESRGPAGAQFDRLDTNKDGILSVDEQAKARRK